jgi:hypothetical protein
MGVHPSLPIPMPAVNLSRLRIQSAKLIDLFDNPDAFLQELHNLFEHYADRTLRSGAIISPIIVLPSFHVPQSVIRHLQMEIGARAQIDPGRTLSLADKLWLDGYYESRLLAAFLLGRIPPNNDSYLERLNEWVSETREPNINKVLLTTSMTRIRQETPEIYFKLLEDWAHPSHKKMWSSAINALLPLLKDTKFHNLPTVFKLIRPIIESAPTTMQNDLSILISTLYNASPIETTYFLRQLITLSTKPQTSMNMRRILPSLPLQLQEELRETVRKSK